MKTTTLSANQALLDAFGRLDPGQHLVGDQVCVIHATLGIDTQATPNAPGAESVWVYVHTDNPHAFSLLSFAAYLGIPEPLIEGAMEFVTVLKHGHQPLEILPLEPDHADGLDLLSHPVAPCVVDEVVNVADIPERERYLLSALAAILLETADTPDLITPYSSDSYLPEHLIADAVEALKPYGWPQIQPANAADAGGAV